MVYQEITNTDGKSVKP